MSQKITIIIADAQHLARIGLSKILSEHYKVYEVNTGTKAIQMVRDLKPQLIIIDYNLPESFSTENIFLIKSLFKEVKILVISSDENEKRILGVSEMGIHGFLTKECEIEEIMQAVKAVLKGEKFFCNKVMNIIINQINQKSDHLNCEAVKLTKREIEIVIFITQGLTNKSIAEKLTLSQHTVHTHRKNIMKKIAAKSTSDVVLYAINTGVIKTNS
ncbi:MAG: response regulator transcription factor [Bacteroidetes bacterium]|nr:response regulator transcription factor [Bacteroidota bacterium]